MSKEIDQKVVEMQFNNKQFETNVQTSLSTLDKLKQGLNLNGASKGLENIGTAAKNCSLATLDGAVQTVNAKFSALEVMAVTTLANITNSAVNAGKRMVSALTLDPIKLGFQEYETQINSIQTILANTSSKGTNLEQVNGALDELNTYADKTIYNFTEMTRNIGTFTAAGVDLDTSVSAIKGISNLAATSGSTAQQASTAMTQLSQAVASGTVKLMDWNSVVNAGMGGQVFQDALKETAKVHNISVDDMIEKEGSFRDTLSNGWLTSDILTETLSKFTGDLDEAQLRTMGYNDEQIASITKMGQTANDAATKVKTFTQLFDTLKEAAQSGWTQSWEIIIGDFEESKELLTMISDTIGGMLGKSADARNNVLEGWKELGGRTDAIDALKNAFNGVLSIIKPVKEALNEIFPPATAEQLYQATEKIKELTSKLQLSDGTSAKLKSTFKGLFAILDIVKQAISAVIKIVSLLMGKLTNLNGGVLNVTANIGDWITRLDEALKENDIFYKTLEKVVNVITKVIDAVKQFTDKIREKIDFSAFETFHAFLDRIHARMQQVCNIATNMGTGVCDAINAMDKSAENNKVTKIFTGLYTALKTIASSVIELIGSVTKTISGKFNDAGFNGIMDIINGLITGGIGIGLIKFIKSLTSLSGEASGFIGSLSGIKNALVDTFGAVQSKLKSEVLMKIAASIALLTASVLVLSLIDSDKLTVALTAITGLFADLMASMDIFTKISGSAKNTRKACTAMIAMSVAVLILSVALKAVSDISWEGLAKGIFGISAMTAIILVFAEVMSKNEKKISKGATSLVLFAVAIKILASVCSDLATLSWEQLAKGLTGVGILLAEVSLFLNNTKFSKDSFKTAAGVVLVSVAIKILASACSDFATLSWEQLGKGLAAIGALLLEISLFAKLTNKSENLISTGIGLIAIAIAMNIFAEAAKNLAAMSWVDLGKSLGAMAVALLAVAGATRLMPKNMVAIGVGLLAVSVALLILSYALKNMATMTWEEIGKGMVVLAGSLLIMAVGLTAMIIALPGAAALIVAVGALSLLVPVLSLLGAMSWETIAKGLITLAASFAIIGVAGLILDPVIGTVIGLAAAFALLGVGVLAIGAGILAAGVGMTALAVGLTALAVIGPIGAAVISKSLAIIIAGIASLIPTILIQVGLGIIELCTVITKAAPAIGEAIKAVVLTLVDVLVECVPVIAEGALVMLVGILQSLVDHTPEIVDLLFQFIIEILNGVARNLPSLIKAVVNVIMAFFEGIVNALKEVDVDILVKGIAGIGLLSAMMLALAGMALLAPLAMVGVLALGLVIVELAAVLTAIGALAQIPGLTWIINEGAALMEAIGNAIGSFIGGIVGGIMSSISSQFPQIGSDLSLFMENVQPFIDGAKAIDPQMLDGVNALVDVVLLLTAASILDALTSWFTGGSSIATFAEELVPFGTAMMDFSNEVSGLDSDLVQKAATAGEALAEMADTLPKTGGVVGFFEGEGDMATLSEQLGPFGKAMKEFSDEVSGIDGDAVQNAATAGEALAAMAEALPKEGGVVGFFEGEGDLAEFASNLVPFGTAIKEFSDEVSGIDGDAINDSATAGKVLADMMETLPKTGGLLEFFTGKNDICAFVTNLIPFGAAIKAFSVQVSGIDEQAIEDSATAGKALTDMMETLPKTGGLLDFFTGKNDICAFVTNLIPFGAAIKAFSIQVAGMDENAVTTAASVGESLTKLSDTIPNTGGLVDFLADTSNIEAFGQGLAALGKYYSDYYEFVKDVDNSAVGDSVSEVDALVSMMEGMASVDTDEINQFGEALKNIGEIGVADFVKAFTDSKSTVTTASEEMLDTFVAGLSNKKSDITYEVEDNLSNSLTIISDRESDFETTAGYLVDGFAAGITNNQSKVTFVSEEMARLSLEAVRRVLDINSPSKKFYELGNFSGLGYVNALNSYGEQSYEAGCYIAESAKGGLEKAIAGIQNRITDEIDSNPTITPVLDLSSVQNGANQLYQLMNDGSNIEVSASYNKVGNIASDMRSNADSTEKMTSQISDLCKQLKGIYEDPDFHNKQIVVNVDHVSSDMDIRDLAEKLDRELGRITMRRR